MIAHGQATHRTSAVICATMVGILKLPAGSWQHGYESVHDESGRLPLVQGEVDQLRNVRLDCLGHLFWTHSRNVRHDHAERSQTYKVKQPFGHTCDSSLWVTKNVNVSEKVSMSMGAENAIWEWGMLEVVREEAQEEEAKAGEEAQEAEAAYTEVVVVVKVGRQQRRRRQWWWRHKRQRQRRQWWWRHRRQRQRRRKQRAEEEVGEEASSECVGVGWAALQGVGASGCEEYEELEKKLVLEVKRKKNCNAPRPCL
jgi:hypothetical protein